MLETIFPILLGKQAATRSPLRFHSPATSLNCEIHEPKVQSEGAGAEESEDEKLIIWRRRHGSFGPEKVEHGAGGASAVHHEVAVRLLREGDTDESFS